MTLEEAEKLRAFLAKEILEFSRNGFLDETVEGRGVDWWDKLTQAEANVFGIDPLSFPTCVVARELYEDFAEIVHPERFKNSEVQALIKRLRTYRPDLVEKANRPFDKELEVFCWLGVNFCGVSAETLARYYHKWISNDLEVTEYRSDIDPALASPTLNNIDDEIPF